MQHTEKIAPDVKNIPVYIVDNDSSVCEALTYVLEGYELDVTSYLSGEEFLEAVRFDTPGCLILDYRMPSMNGKEVQNRLLSLNSCIKVIFLTSHGDLPLAIGAFRDGACDFHQKPVKASDLLPSIAVAQQKSYQHYSLIQNEALFCNLTGREKDVFALVIGGMMNKQIADRLCVSLRTVEVHRSHMMEKLEAGSIAELVRISEILIKK